MLVYVHYYLMGDHGTGSSYIKLSLSSGAHPTASGSVCVPRHPLSPYKGSRYPNDQQPTLTTIYKFGLPAYCNIKSNYPLNVN